jgi:hypothetical protein
MGLSNEVANIAFFPKGLLARLGQVRLVQIFARSLKKAFFFILFL